MCHGISNRIEHHLDEVTNLKPERDPLIGKYLVPRALSKVRTTNGDLRPEFVNRHELV